MFERNDVNAVVITTVATNAEYFFMPVYFAPKKDVRNHRIITFSQIVAILSVTVESSLLTGSELLSVRIILLRSTEKMKRVFTMNDLCTRINP